MNSQDHPGAARPWSAILCAGAVALGAIGASASAAAAPSTYAQRVQYLQQHLAKPGSLKARYLVKPPNAEAQATARMQALQAQGMKPAGPGVTVPYWSTSITSPFDGITYRVSMIGTSPYAPKPRNTNLKYIPIIVRMHFTGGFDFDPTKNANCDTVPVSTRFFNSPLFRGAFFDSNGVNVTPKKMQLISAFQRANFWNAVQGTDYGLTLITTTKTPIVVDYTPNAPGDTVIGFQSQCDSTKVNPLGLISIDEYDALVQSLAATYSTPDQTPLVLTYNVVEYVTAAANCCVIGYHNAVQSAGGTQVYAVGAYVDPGIFSGLADIGAWSHEIGEMVDDPFVQSVTGIPGGLSNDLTPAWGNIGQVSGCQNNLEVGDPLTGTQYTVTGAAGFDYHYQDLAFHDWFYRTPSTSAGGTGSFKGVLAAGGQGACSSSPTG
jgi:hypothetical protein